MGGGASTQAPPPSNTNGLASPSTAPAIQPKQVSIKSKEELVTPKKEPTVAVDLSIPDDKAVSNNKLKKMALGIQGYKDQQRDYDVTLSQLELNKTAQVEWSDPKSLVTPNKPPRDPLENKFSSPQLFSPSASMTMSPADKRKLREMANPQEPMSASSSFYGGPRPNSSSFYVPPSGIPVRPFPKDKLKTSNDSEDKPQDFPIQGRPMMPPGYGPGPPSMIPPNNMMQGPPHAMGMASPMVHMQTGPPQGVPQQNHSNKMQHNGQVPMPGPLQIPGPGAPMNGPPPRMMMMSPHFIPGQNGANGPPPNSAPVNVPFARPPPSSAPVPVVKETKNVKRNRIQLPTTYSHAKPTTGDWLNKRYIVNNYILLDTLGVGSYGEVRLCKDRVTDKLFAIKIISKEFLRKKKNGKTSETYFEDIKREIAIMKKLLHPNILRLYEVLDDPKVNKMYLVLEYMKRGDLVNVLKKRTEEERKLNESLGGNVIPLVDENSQFSPLSDFDLWHIFRQVIFGVRYLHFQNIVHGDIKPQNLLLGEDGVVKVADFGISQMLSESHEKLADAGGTPAFMAPELCENKSFSGQLADIWAIGATVYMLKFGHPPFIAKNIVNLYYKICNDPLIFPGPIDPGFKNLIEGMLEKNPDKRITMQQIVIHPWFRFPPAPTPKIPLRMLTAANTPAISHKVEEKEAQKPKSDAEKEKQPEALNFQPPSTYDAEEEAAMKIPIQLVTPSDVYMSIGGIRRLSESNIENAIVEIEEDYEDEEDDDDDEEAEKEAKPKKFAALKRPPSEQNPSEAKEVAEKRDAPSLQLTQPGVPENLLQTNWGNDVFQIVDDVQDDDDDDEVDDIDDDSDDEDEKKDKISPQKKGKKAANASSMQLTAGSAATHTEMSAEEEMRRSKQFLKKNAGKKSSHDMKGSNSDAKSARSNNSSQMMSSGLTSPVAKVGRSNDYGLDSPVTNPSTPQQISKRFFPPGMKENNESSHKFTMTKNDNHSRISLVSQGDFGDEEPEQLSNEEFAKLMDTLSQQPSKAANTHKSYDETDDFSDDDDEGNDLPNLDGAKKKKSKTVYEDNDMDGSFDFLIAPLQNTKNEIGCAYYSEQGQRQTQEDRYVAVINFAQYFQQHQILSTNATASTSSSSSSNTNMAASNPLLASAYNQINNVRDILSQFSLFAVFDGHSGSKTSHYLVTHFMKKLIENERFLEPKQLETVIAETFLLLDYEIIRMLRPDEDTSGSTGVVVLFDGRRNTLTVAGVGDSLCVLSRNGRAIVMNKMHRLDIPGEKERVRNNGGTVINNRVNGVIAISRAFGDIQFKSIGSNLHDSTSNKPVEFPPLTFANRQDVLPFIQQVEGESLITAQPDVRSEVITPKTEFAVIASDGLWDVMAPQVVIRFVRDRLLKHKDLQKVAKELTKEALNNHSVDNVTVVLVTFHSSFSSIQSQPN